MLYITKNITDPIRYYTGIGSRRAPKEVLQIMTDVAEKLSNLGWILRSGGAEGSDTAFEKGAQNKAIYYASDATPASITMASRFHPAWRGMNEYAQSLHGRNVFQVIGHDFNIPSHFLICWTKDGCESHKTRMRETGGTGTAISVADFFHVPIYNLKNKQSMEKIRQWLE